MLNSKRYQDKSFDFSGFSDHQSSENSEFALESKLFYDYGKICESYITGLICTKNNEFLFISDEAGS